MDFNKFDNDTDESDANYFAYVAWLSELTAEEMRRVKGSPEQQKQALCRYFKRGDKANLTPPELVDFLGVNTPSIIDMAGYSDDEGDALFAIFNNITREEINQTSLIDAAQQPALLLE